MTKGKVWLVGAGPSDAGLFTIKGKQVLDNADVVVYDRLVGQGILSFIPEQAEKISVGKRAGAHPVKQEEINQILLDQALAGKKVVRLKGGDPFLFGRGGEELELLVKNQIPYEIVPGITSAIAVPAYQGIPVTHRDFCSSVHIITGHKKGGVDKELDFQALVKTKGTLVFLMSTMALEMICTSLMKAGMKPETPAAALQSGTSARQRKVIADVSTLYQKAMEHKIEAPAIFVFGDVCRLSEEFSWYEKMPLSGKRIAVIRYKETKSILAEKLRVRGAEVLELPMIEKRAIHDNLTFQKIMEQNQLNKYLVFTSPHAVSRFMGTLKDQKADIRSLFCYRIAAIGKRTVEALADYGLLADYSATVAGEKRLLKELAIAATANSQLYIIGQSIKTAGIKSQLCGYNQNLSVDIFNLYEEVWGEPGLCYDIRDELNSNNIDYMMFSNTAGVKAFTEVFNGINLEGLKAICIGEQVSACVKENKMMPYEINKGIINDQMIDQIEQLLEQ